jgi:hypothetical protein
MNDECTHHTHQAVAAWVAPAPTAGVGGCSGQNLKTPAPTQGTAVAVIDASRAGQTETRNAAAWRDVARFLVAQANPGLRYLGR